MPTYDVLLSSARADLDALLGFVEETERYCTKNGRTRHATMWRQRGDKIRGAISNLKAIPGVGAVLADSEIDRASRTALIGESIAADVRQRIEAAPPMEPVRRVSTHRRYLEGDTLDPRCTGYVDDLGYLAHDGPTCPIHESGDVDPGDEKQPKQSAGYVELVDGTELAVSLGDPVVFDPTGRDLIRCAVVGIVIDCDQEAQEPGEQPAPIVRVNDTDDDTTGQLVVVRRAFAVLTAEEA